MLVTEFVSDLLRENIESKINFFGRGKADFVMTETRT